jgi:hypothetical protein
MLWQIGSDKNKIKPFTSAVSDDYYKGINLPEANSFSTLTMKSRVDIGKAFFIGERFHG